MLKKVITSNWILALLIVVPVVVFLTDIFSKYNCELVSQGSLDHVKNSRVYFEDLDSDSQIEKIMLFKQTDDNTVSFQYFKENGGMVDQVNFPFNFHIDTQKLNFADADGDGNQEIYIYSFEKDSLFLNWLQVTPDKSSINSLALCKLNYYNEELLDYSIGDIYCIDLEHDGQKELVFAINGGYSYSPRQIFKVDIIHKKVERSVNTGSAIGPMLFYDLNRDGKLEIICEGQVAPVRDWFNLPYNLPAPYLKVYNSDLSFFFSPVKLCEGIQSITKTYVVNNGKNNELICNFLSSSSDCEPFQIYKIALDGKKIDSLDYKTSDRSRFKYVFQNDKGNFITQIGPSEFLKYTDELETVNTFRLKEGGNLNFILAEDINNDGRKEYFFSNSDSREFYIYSDNFKWFHSINLNDDISIAGEELYRKPNQFYVKTAKGYFVYSFTKNPYYFFRYLFYLAIYLTGVLIFFLFQKIIESRLKERDKLRNQVHELQMKSLKNQLDPHFMYNTFNTIASVIKQGRNNEAYDLFILLSKMVRTNLDSSDEIYTTLKGELDFVKDYLIIQKFRFKELFEYTINVEKNVDTDLKIPKMLMQIHIENALKHGIRNLKTGGLLQIRVFKGIREVKIEIEDNGIGRMKSKFLNTGNEGIGLKTIKQIIELNNQKSKNRISQKITDIKDQKGKAGGTLVVLTISWKT